MSVSIVSGLQRQVIMSAALHAMKVKLISLGIFSLGYRNVKLEGTDEMEVPYYPLEASDSEDFVEGTGYEFGDTYTQDTRKVTINKRKYQPLSVSSATFARNPQLNLEVIGAKKGEKLAEDVIKDVLSLITAANYGPAVHTFLSSTMDFAVVNETIGAACDTSNWPDTMRALALKSAYQRSLVSDLKDASLYASDNPIKRGVLEDVAGFDIYKEQSIPANVENLVGFAALPAAMIVGFSPIAPKDNGRIVEYETMSDEETGLTIEYRRWFDADLDIEKSVLECNYGYAKGEAAALKRIISA